MRIATLDAWPVVVPLTRPYTVAYETTDSVEIMVARIVSEDGASGLGAASPSPSVTGETFDATRGALAAAAAAVRGADLRWRGRLLRDLGEELVATPAACAALDMAVHDLWARSLGRPLVDLLGRVHDALPTSITIGIKGVADTLAEAEEYRGRGFRVLKVKLGLDPEEDLERLRRLRERWPDAVLRTDMNQGYGLGEVRRYLEAAERLDIEFTEQPVPPAALRDLLALPEEARRRFAADESVQSPADALHVAPPPQPCGIVNVKLMKCGGIRNALAIAGIAEAAGLDLMWGCMDESVISIAAALHTAFACPRTRWLDLDGSFDLARDVARGGFTVEEGVMRTTDAPGLGVCLL